MDVYIDLGDPDICCVRCGKSVYFEFICHDNPSVGNDYCQDCGRAEHDRLLGMGFNMFYESLGVFGSTLNSLLEDCE